MSAVPENTAAKAPTIGIIMAVYNGEKYLEETLRNVQSQSVGSWECICVDDGSTDGTAAIVERLALEDGRFRLVRQANAGPSAARNRGFTHLHPNVRYVTFLDGDDLWVQDGLQILRDELEKHPHLVAAYGLAETIDEKGRILDPGNWPAYGRRRLTRKRGRLVPLKPSEPTNFAYFSLLTSRPAVVPPNMVLIRREALYKVGLFDPALWVIPDWDLWLRLSRLSDLHFIDRVVAFYRRHSNNFSEANPRTKKELTYLIIKAFAAPNNTPEQVEYLRQSYRALHKNRMLEKFTEARRTSWRKSPLRSAFLMVYIVAHLMRYIRGYPDPTEGWRPPGR